MNERSLLELADGWREVRPRSTPWSMLFQKEYFLSLFETDFRCEQIAEIGGLDCPIAFDEEARAAYCVRAIGELKEKEGSIEGLMFPAGTILKVSLDDKKVEKILDIPAELTLAWLLSLLPGRKKLISFSSRTGQLVFVDLTSKRLRLVDCDGNVHWPADISIERNQIVFSGRFGISINSFSGSQAALLPDVTYRHAALHPKDSRVALEAAHGRGIAIWDSASGKVDSFGTGGRRPEWSPDGKEIWYVEDASSLWKLNIETRQSTRVAKFLGGTDDCDSYGDKIIFTPDGQFAISNLTIRTRVSAEEERRKLDEHREFSRALPEYLRSNLREPDFRFDHTHRICVLDMQAREVWTHPGYAHRLTWVKKP